MVSKLSVFYLSMKNLKHVQHRNSYYYSVNDSISNAVSI